MILNINNFNVERTKDDCGLEVNDLSAADWLPTYF